MKVYVVVQTIHSEPSTIVAVFADKDEAHKCAEFLRVCPAGWVITVIERELLAKQEVS